MSPPGRRRWLAVGAATVAGLLLLPVLLLSIVQGGGADGLVRSALSERLGHAVTFARMRVGPAPGGSRIVFEDLRIADPPRFGRGELARIRELDLDVRWAPLLVGRLEAPRVRVVDPVLHLKRRGPGDDNYSFGSGGASSSLGATRTLEIVGGRVDMDDPQRELTLSGTVSHDPAAGALPLKLDGTGVLKGQPFIVAARGGALNGRKPGERHAIAVTLVDGAVKVRLDGSTAKPFDFRDLDIDLAASGPNAGDLVYLFNLLAPNSAAFQFTAHLRKQDKLLVVTRLKGRLGDTDLTGEIRSDHSKPRRLIQARLRSQRLTADDLKTALASVPDHAVTRSTPGRPSQGHAPTGRLFSPTPFSLNRLQHNDIALDYAAATATGFGRPLSVVTLKLDLDAGRLRLRPLTFRVAGGEGRADVVIDTDSPTPSVAVQASLKGLNVGSLAKTGGFSGRLDADLDAHGSGASMAQAAAVADGRASVRVRGGSLPKLDAEALQGDLFGMIGAALGDRKAPEPLRCVAAEFTLRDGVMTATRLDVGTGGGLATGGGLVDLKRETLSLYLRATSQGDRPPVQLKTPITLAGPIAHPQVKVHLSKSSLSLGGMFSALAKPFKGGGTERPKAAAAPGC